MNSPLDLSGALEEFEALLISRASELGRNNERLSEALEYAIRGPGKRVRPELLLRFCAMYGAPLQNGFGPALALEFVHTYSLVHDDLPCLDNDDLRRGRPTVHRKFGEDVALLVGDALLTDAFGILAGLQLSEVVRVELVRCLAKSAGSSGMVRGQALDVHWTGRQGGYERDDLDTMHRLKTGYLLGAACQMGALAGGATRDQSVQCFEFGVELGLAYQIVDDLIDDMAGTGKSSGKDEQMGKLTYLSIMNRSDAQKEAEARTESAISRLKQFQGSAQHVREFALSLLHRNS